MHMLLLMVEKMPMGELVEVLGGMMLCYSGVEMIVANKVLETRSTSKI